MKNRWIGGIAVLMSMILLFSACDDSKNVARLNNSFLTMEAFKYYLSSEKVDQSSLIFETAEIRLNDFIDKRLVIESAYKDSIHLQSALQNKVKEKEENMVYLQVIRDQVYSEVMPEKMMREIYKKQGLEFGISHIFIPVSPQMPKTEISNARQKLKTVHNRLLKGADFEEMARLHSQDKTSSGKGGWLGFLKWHDKGYGASFYEALHKLKKGQLSNVIRSSRGLHIVKLKTIREREQIPFEEKLDYLRRDYYTNHPEKVNEAYYGFIDKLKKNYNYSLYENTVDSLVHWFDKTSYDYRTNQGFNEFINSLTNRQMNMPVYSFSEQTVIVFDFLNRVMKNLPQGARPELGMKEPWDRILFLDPTKQPCLKYGYDHDFDSRNPVAKKVRRFLEDEMYKIQKSRNIDNRVNPTEDECRQYFTENAQRFEKDPKVKVQEIYVKGKELADWLYHRIQNGESFAKLAEQYTERDSVVNRQGVLGFISPVRHRGITHKAFRMLPGEVSEPIYYSGHYSVIKVLERQPGEPRTYEQAEDIVKAALKRKKTDDLHENWLKELRSESQITTFPDVLAAEFAGENE